MIWFAVFFEQGTHEELLAMYGVYASLHQTLEDEKEHSHVDCYSSMRFYTNEDAPRAYRPTVFGQNPVSVVSNSLELSEGGEESKLSISIERI